jgi:hypothetical protein
LKKGTSQQIKKPNVSKALPQTEGKFTPPEKIEKIPSEKYKKKENAK